MAEFIDRIASLPQTLTALARDAFGDHLSTVVVHGSAYRRRDFVPFWSDFDCHFYLASPILDESDLERLERVLHFRRGHAELDLNSYGLYYIQVFFLLAEFLPSDWAAPVEGTFEIVYGTRPSGWDSRGGPDAIASADATLSNLPGLIARLTTNVSDLHRTAFARSVRSLGTYVKPALYSAATLITRDPVPTWNADRAEVLEIVEREQRLPSAHAFYDRVVRWRDIREDDEQLEAMMRDGVRTLVALTEWYGRASS